MCVHACVRVCKQWCFNDNPQVICPRNSLLLSVLQVIQKTNLSLTGLLVYPKAVHDLPWEYKEIHIGNSCWKFIKVWGEVYLAVSILDNYLNLKVSLTLINMEACIKTDVSETWRTKKGKVLDQIASWLNSNKCAQKFNVNL